MFNTTGVGVDIENIDRFLSMDIKNNKLFLDRIFTQNELDYCFSKKKPAQHLAARYAGKEAVVKAINSAGLKNPGYNKIEIINDDDGIPRVNITDDISAKLQIIISLSHCDDKAIAFALATDLQNPVKK